MFLFFFVFQKTKHLDILKGDDILQFLPWFKLTIPRSVARGVGRFSGLLKWLDCLDRLKSEG